MQGALDTIIQSLLDAPVNLPQWQLKSYLKQVYSIAPKHGIKPKLIPSFIAFLCKTKLISTTTKVTIIEEYLIPNGPLSNEVIDVIISHLGVPTVYTPEDNLLPPKYIQIALIKWLVHVFFLLPDTQSKSNASTWFQLWQFDYLQQWITYVLVWSTHSPLDIRAWRLKILEKVANNSGYTNARGCATLILRRYITILNGSSRISTIIQGIKCTNEQLMQIQSPTIDLNFIKTLKIVLNREASFRYSNSVVQKQVDSLMLQLQTSDMQSGRLNFDNIVPSDKSVLSNTETIVQLYNNWQKFELPRNIELILPDSQYNITQLYPLALSEENVKNNDKTVEEFWIRLYSYMKIHMGRCFQEKIMTVQERMTLFNKILHSAQMYTPLITPLVSDFLTLPNLFANRKLFITICTRLLPIMPPPNNMAKWRKTLLKIIAICLLSKNSRSNKQKWSSINESTFGIVCYSIIEMIKNWLSKLGNETLTLQSLEILGDVRKLLLANIRHSIDNRHLIIPMISLVDEISSFIYPYQDNRLPEHFNGEILDRIILKNNAMDKLLTLDDPLLLNACSKYLITIKNIGKDRTKSDIYVHLQNQYIMDLTNYLWRNKIVDSKKIFGVPTQYIKTIFEHTASNKNSHIKFRDIFSIIGISTTSYLAFTIIRELEKGCSANIHYSFPLSEDGFKAFQKSITADEDGKWIVGISTFTDLRVAILKQLSTSRQYRSIALFLATYLKSLSQIGINKEQPLN